MKTMVGLVVGACSLLSVCQCAAQIIEHYDFPSLNIPVPDNDPFGVSDVEPISTSAIDSIEEVSVTLTLSGGFNGDLYVTLAHDSGFAVLLNRPGRGATGLQFPDFGYNDPGLSLVTFSDAAPNGDVHVYRYTLFLDNNQALGGPLTGTWAPDGRAVSPTTVGVSDPRTALLSSFAGTGANGDWTLLLSDSAAGGTSTLTGWSLDITAVPEPASQAAVGMALVAMAIVWNRTKGLRDQRTKGPKEA